MYTYEGYSHKDLINLLGEKDGQWFISGCPIPYSAQLDQWNRKTLIDEKVSKANLEVHKTPDFIAPKIYINSDDLGIGGIVNQADGKTYDSKSEYYKSIKAKGLVIDDSPKARPSTPKTKDINWEKAVAETIKQTKGV
jgi:hypothetical protein